mmetsp:Transcript_73122/g.169568  ORF Transcript_73122/g.169568 Transcript_73122/m.169568 type:complete len:858 (-) Transcript_73122:151-2724(-)
MAEAEAGDEEMKGGEEAPKEKEARGEVGSTGAKTEDGKAEDAPKEPEKPKETESDALDDDRAKLKEPLGFNTEDTTLNTVTTAGGKLLVALAEGGLQHLLVGARANVGLKAGRYMFEVMVLAEKPASPQGQQQSQQRQPTVRLGFAAAGSSLFLADGEDSVCFDTEGFFAQGRLKRRVAQKFGPEQVVAVVLNLDTESRNANTISLFRNGARISEPQPLPECLRGKALFPAVSFKGAALRMNFSGPPLKALPFSCRMLQDAASADCEVLPPAVPEDGRFEVAMPVALPEEGFFDWVDQFLAKKPGYVELSNRAIIDWATKSGIWRKNSGKGCNDRPETGFGVPQLDDMSVPRLLAAVAPALPRNYVIPEVKGNLLSDFRKVLVERFANFHKTAYVMMGDPSEEFKEGVQALLLQDKRAKAELEIRRKKQEAERKRLIDAKRQKAKAKGEDGEKEEAADDEKMGEAEEELKAVELTAEDRKVVFRKKALPDILPADLAKAFTRFSLPKEEEGFDKISFEWQPAEAATGYLREWVLKRKATQRVEDIQPSKWFKENLVEWHKLLLEWKKKQTEWKKVIDQLQEWKKEGKKKTPEDDKKEGDDKPTEIDAEDLDVFRVENVCDVGSGEPLFANFEYEDWCLLALRYELHLLINAFRKDINDPDRPTFHESHLMFYYNRYFTKSLDLKVFNVTSNKELVEMIKDTMALNPTNGMLECQLGEDTQMDNFVKLAEEHRRDRQRRLDAGDESAELKFLKPAPAQAQTARTTNQWQKVPGGQAVPARFAPAVRPAAPASAVPNKTQFQAAPRAAGAIQPARTVAQPSGPVAAQKRPYTPAPKATIIPAAKQARTTSYGGQGSSRW